MKMLIALLLFTHSLLANEDTYQKQKRQIESVVSYLESKCAQKDPEKLKKDCPDPKALDSYRQQLQVINSLINQVENSSSNAPLAPVRIDTTKQTNPSKSLSDQSYCDYEVYPTGPVGDVVVGILPKENWSEATKKNDLFKMDFRFLEKDLAVLSKFKRDLSCKTDSDCELITIAQKVCEGGSSQFVISKKDREIDTVKTQVSSLSDMALNLVEKDPTTKSCPEVKLNNIAKCEKCRCQIEVAPK